MTAHSRNSTYHRRDTALILSFSATDPAVILQEDLAQFLSTIEPGEPICIKTRPDLADDEDGICIEICHVALQECELNK